MSKTTALITGGCGFIGRHLCHHLLQHTDWHLILLDSLNYATNVPALLGDRDWDSTRVRLLYHDLRAPIHESLREKIGDVKYIFNLASESHVDKSIYDPVPFVQNNVALMLNMLEYARIVKPEKFFQISTDEVYGPAPDGYAFKEWDVAIPSNPYAASKAAQEAICISYWRTYNLPIVITNTMNNFGSSQHKEKFMPKVIRCLLSGQPVPVHGERRPDGTWVAGSRVWLHARNHADALLHLANNCTPEMYPDADRPSRFHIAGDEELSNLEVVERVASILGVPPEFEWVDWHGSRPGHDRRYALDGNKLRKTWTPPMTLDESLQQTVKSYM